LTHFTKATHTHAYVTVGTPIEVVQCDEPTADMITEYHEKYIQGLKDVFEANKTKYGIDKDAHLNIVY
jgi:hypothetical protein